jgi:hypothetical protein
VGGDSRLNDHSVSLNKIDDVGHNFGPDDKFGQPVSGIFRNASNSSGLET